MRSRPTALAAPALALVAAACQSYEVVSVSSDSVVADGDSGYSLAIDADGLVVAFDSVAANLVPHDDNGNMEPGSWQPTDVFIRKRRYGVTARASVATGGEEADGPSLDPALSADGRIVAFTSYAENLAPASETSGGRRRSQVYVRDLEEGTTELVSAAPDGAPGNYSSGASDLDASGRFVLFSSLADNLVEGDTNWATDGFVRDRLTGTTTRVTLGYDGGEPDSRGIAWAISGDGGHVCFRGYGDGWVPETGSRVDHIYVRDLSLGTVERVSVSDTGNPGAFHSYRCSMSAEGNVVAFDSSAWNLVPDDTNGGGSGYAGDDIFVRDRAAGRTTRVSVTSDGTQVEGSSGLPYISADGRYVAFVSEAGGLVPGVPRYHLGAYLHDRWTGTTALVSGHPARYPYRQVMLLALSSSGSRLVFSAYDAVSDSPVELRLLVYVYEHHLAAWERP